MRRNLGNELIVALLAAVSLLFAAVFAVLLSTSTSQRPTEAPTEPAVASSTPSIIATLTQPTKETDVALPADVTRGPTQAVLADTARPQGTLTTDDTGQATEIAATAPSTAETETELPSATPLRTEDLATAEPEIAPANLTLTAIRASIDERRQLTAADLSPTASPTDIAAIATPSTGETELPTMEVLASATPLPTEILATATPEIAPANLTLTAIRASIDERPEG